MRLFYGLGFGPAALREMAAVQERLARRAPGARFPGPDALHLTLAFLGEVEDRRLPDALAVLGELSPTPLALRFSRVGNFSREAGGLWVLEPEDCPGLLALESRLERALEKAGLPFARRPFRPHVTLARRVSFPGGDPAEEELLPRPIQAACGAVTLWRSQLRPQGALYTPLGRAAPD